MPFLIGAFGLALPVSAVVLAAAELSEDLLSFLVSPQAVANTDSASTAAEAAESRKARDGIMRSPPVALTCRPAYARATAGVRGSCGRAPRGRAGPSWGPARSRSAGCR